MDGFHTPQEGRDSRLRVGKKFKRILDFGFLCKRASESCDVNATTRKFPVEQGETYTVLYNNREYTLILCDNGWNELFIKNL